MIPAERVSTLRLWSPSDGPAEHHMGHAAGRRGRLDRVVALEGLQLVPEADAAAEEDRDDHDVHLVDEPGGQELADQRRTAADPDVHPAGSLARRLERFGGRGLDE